MSPDILTSEKMFSVIAGFIFLLVTRNHYIGLCIVLVYKYYMSLYFFTKSFTERI